MAKGKSSGCIGVVLVCILVFGVLGVALVMYLFKARSDTPGTFLHPTPVETQTLVFQEDALPRFPFPQPGEPIGREQFVAYMIDENATELAQESFRKIASQSKVSWNLKTSNVADRNGTLIGEFELAWEIHSRHSTRGSSVTVRGEFSEESRSNLLNLHRGDWVVVEGELSFDGSTATIKNARLATDALPAESE